MSIRIGVMGAGWVAQDRHIPSFQKDERSDLVAIYDRSASRAESAASAFNVPTGTDDLADFFGTGLDAVSICTSPWSHAELAIAAFGNGCHVLTEKPMAIDLSEAEDMAKAASGAGKTLCVSHNLLFSRAVRSADRFLQSAGETLYVNGLQLSSDHRRLPTWYEDLPGGLLFDEIPHLLYLAQHYLGKLTLDGVRVLERSARGHPTISEVRLRGQQAQGSLTVISGAPLSEWHVTAVATRGMVDIDLFRDIAVRLRPDGSHKATDILRTSGKAIVEHGRGFMSSGARLATKRLFWGHDVLISRFLDTVSDGAPSPITVDDALGIVRLTDALLEAAAPA